ncbi:bifunctional glutamate N-acetyltransferase/amino-acid acetyltransferase ArgJ [bacterium]|nr:bifunctional glutamate N-acetyltransferase/amino-acid acetyltransferase ArgJ [bacterium]
MALTRSPLAPDAFPSLPEVAGVRLATAGLGLYRGRARDDLLIARFPDGAAVGGAFTTSATRSADVDWCRAALKRSGGRAGVLVVNAGNSNAFTGAAGVAKNDATIAAAAALASCSLDEVYVGATGVIGEPLPASLVADGVRAAWSGLGPADWEAAARAIMTTDTFPKASGAVCDIEGRRVAIVGIAKGSGMIAPNMATTLNYVFTDAPLGPHAVQALLSRFVDLTFNSITVDGDTSTSDTLMLFATGGAKIDEPDDPRLAGFRDALHGVFQDLALQIVRDGEGATKLITITVTGATDDAAARIVAASIANSPLFKTAMAAGDANWGRIVMAIGKSGAPVDRDRIAIRVGGVLLASHGARAPDYSESAATAAVSGPAIEVEVDLGLGDGRARMWTCDLTDGYVRINGAYRS